MSAEIRRLLVDADQLLHRFRIDDPPTVDEIEAVREQVAALLAAPAVPAPQSQETNDDVSRVDHQSPSDGQDLPRKPQPGSQPRDLRTIVGIIDRNLNYRRGHRPVGWAELLAYIEQHEAGVRDQVAMADPMADAAEMLWVVLANVSGGDWTQQSKEWGDAAARWRDNYFRVCGEPTPGAVAGADCAVDPVVGTGQGGLRAPHDSSETTSLAAVPAPNEEKHDEEVIVAMLAACEATIRHLWDIAGRFDSAQCNRIRDQIHILNTVTLPSIRDLQAKALAAVPAQEEGWQPMEMAPKDRTSVIVFCPLRSTVGEAFFDPDSHGGTWWWANQSEDYYTSPMRESGYEPTHWMPLPQPPGAPAAPHDARGEQKDDQNDVARGRSADVDSATGSPRKPQPDGSQPPGVQAVEDLARLCSATADRLTLLRAQLLDAYRRKRAVDGLNNRLWDANVHWKAEQAIVQLEAQLAALAPEERWTGDDT